MSHHDPFAASFAERVIMLKDGEVASDMEDPSQEEIISMVTSLSDV
jgi:ABC-type cobalamin/Fe3+-siderophores transport system ATPase subunit